MTKGVCQGIFSTLMNGKNFFKEEAAGIEDFG